MKGLLVGLCLFVGTSFALGCSGSSPQPNEQPGPDAGPDVRSEASSEAGPDAGSDGDAAGVAALAWSPSSQDFGTVSVGAHAAQSMTLTNGGTASTGTLKLALGTSEASADFTLGSDTCSGQSLAPQQTCTASLTFQPASEGAASDTLVATAGSLTASAALSGTGGAASALAFSTPTFASVAVGQTGKDTVTLKNGGTSATGTITLGLTGTNAKVFALAADTCTGQVLAAGADCTAEVDFTPTAAGTDTATLGATIAGATAASVALSATATATATLAFSTPQTFAATAVGQTATQTLTLTNGGGVATGTLTLTLGGTNAAAFALSNDTCTKHTLAPAAKCTVDVAFTPTAAGSDTATLDATDGTVSASAALDGSGTAAAALAFATVPAFGQVVVGQTAPQTLKLTNSGTAATAAPTLAITSATKAAAAMYTTSADTCTGKAIAAGGSCTVVVTFAPTAAGAQTATLTATAGALSATASLTGVGESVAQLVVAGTGDFVSVIGQPTMQSFVFTNSGEQTSGPVTVALTGAAQFQVQTNGCKGVALTSATGATPSCTVVVTFTAAAAGPVTGSIAATATPGASASMALSGTSAAALTLSAAQPFAAVVGQNSTQTFTVTNTGGQTSGAPKVTLAGSGDFTKTADTCTGAVLQGAGSNKNTCTVGVTFAPLDTKAQTATLTVAATPGTAPSAALTGTGTAAAVSFSLAAGSTTLPGYFKYAGTAVGQTTSQTFTATNTGNSTSKALTATIVSGPFTIVKGSDDCTGKTLDAGKTCTFDVDFAPGKQVGPSTGEVSFDDTNVADALVTTLWGAGLSATAQLVTTIPSGTYGLPTAVDLTKVYAFGTVTFPNTSAEEFTVTNYSTVALTTALVVAADANASADFTLKNGCTSAALTAYTAADPSCSYTVTFAPPSGAAATAQTASYAYTEGNVASGTNAVSGTP